VLSADRCVLGGGFIGSAKRTDTVSGVLVQSGGAPLIVKAKSTLNAVFETLF